MNWALCISRSSGPRREQALSFWTFDSKESRKSESQGASAGSSKHDLDSNLDFSGTTNRQPGVLDVTCLCFLLLGFSGMEREREREREREKETEATKVSLDILVKPALLRS